MARISLYFVIAAALLLAISTVWMGVERLAPGIDTTFVDPSGAGLTDASPPEAGLVAQTLLGNFTLRLPTYSELFDLHMLSGAALLPLLGGFAGFAAARQRRALGLSFGFSRLAGWNGLSIALALVAYLILNGTGLLPETLFSGDDNLLPNLFSEGDDLSGPLIAPTIDPSQAIADIAGLWALFVGAGALIGSGHNQGWAGFCVFVVTVLTLLAYGAARLGFSSVGGPSVGEPSNLYLALPALAVFVAATLQLRHFDTATGPHLWVGSVVMLAGAIYLTLDPLYFSFSEDRTVGESHWVLYCIAPFVMLAAWRAHRGIGDQGLFSWLHAVGLAFFTLGFIRSMTFLSLQGMPKDQPDFPEYMADAAYDASMMSFYLIAWIAFGFILCGVRQRPLAADPAPAP